MMEAMYVATAYPKSFSRGMVNMKTYKYQCYGNLYSWTVANL